MTHGFAGSGWMKASKLTVMEVEVACVPLLAIWLQSDESQCIRAKRRRGGGGAAKLIFILLCVFVLTSLFVFMLITLLER